jgi:hypothetical protein
VGAWVVNQLAHERPDLIDDLLGLAEELRAAQRNLRGDELRELTLRRRQLITGLAREAVRLASRRHGRGNLPVAEIQATFTAALSDPDVAAVVRVGQLTKTVEYAGFGETPRPQLRLVQGGDPPASPAEPAKPAKSAPPARSEIDVGLSSSGSRRNAGPDSPTSMKKRADEEQRRADEERRAEEEAEQRAAEEARRADEQRKADERAAAAELRRSRAAAHRELLQARTELADAEAVRAAAERSVLAARRRVEKASAAVNALAD